MEKGSAEFKIYMNMAIDAAEALANQGRNDEASDVLFTYMMDLAAMATSGNKGAIAMRAVIPGPQQAATVKYVADRYNDIAGTLEERLRGLEVGNVFTETGLGHVSEERVWAEFLTLRSRVPKLKYTVEVAKKHPGKTVLAAGGGIALGPILVPLLLGYLLVASLSGGR